MKRYAGVFALGLLAAGAALAHTDAEVVITADGTLTNIPSDYRPAKLQVDFSAPGSDAPPVSAIVLTLGDRQTRLPACVTDLIRSSDMTHVSASGSWSDHLSGLPPYLHVMFGDPAQPASGHVFLFNLRNGKVISFEEQGSIATDIGRNLWRKPVDLAARCPAAALGALLDAAGPGDDILPGAGAHRPAGVGGRAVSAARR